MSPYKAQKTDYLVLILILAVALIARVEKLDSSLWYDEIMTVINYVRLSFTDLFFVDSAFNNHPFYSFQAKLSVVLFGESNWSVRLPAVLFGIASIAATWRLACRVSGVRQAHVCALLLALSYHHVWFSQNARGYSELMFWCMASTLVLMDCLRSASWKRWVAYGLILSAALYTHLTAAFFFLAQAVIVAVVLLGKSRIYPLNNALSVKQQWLMPFAGYLIGGLIALMLYSPSMVHLIGEVTSISNDPTEYVMPEYRSSAWAALEILRSFARLGPLTPLIALVAVTLTGIGMFSIYRKEPLVPALLVLHITITTAILWALSMRLWPRFYFIDIGFVLLFITQGVFVCCRQISLFLQNKLRLRLPAGALFVASSVLMIGISLILLVKNYQLPKQDFDSTFKYIMETKQLNDRVLSLGLATIPFNRFYAQDWLGVESEQELRKFNSEADTTWLVIIFPTRSTRKYDGIMRYVDKNYSLAKTFRGTLGDGNILVFKSEPRD